MQDLLNADVRCVINGSINFCLNGVKIPQSNLILDSFSTFFFFRDVKNLYLEVGTGTTPATSQDTTLDEWLAEVKSSATVESRIADGFQWFMTFRFGPGSFNNQTITECGLAAEDVSKNSRPLVTRTVLDQSITLGEDDVLDVEYTIQLKFLLSSEPKVLTYDGVDYNFSLQPTPSDKILTSTTSLLSRNLKTSWYLCGDQGERQLTVVHDAESRLCTMSVQYETTPSKQIKFGSNVLRCGSVKSLAHTFFDFVCTPSLIIPPTIPAKLDLVLTLQF